MLHFINVKKCYIKQNKLIDTCTELFLDIHLGIETNEKLKDMATKMQLTIETKSKFVAGDIENAYNEAMNATNIYAFINMLELELPAYEIIRTSSHIAIHHCDARAAIIENLFN